MQARTARNCDAQLGNDSPLLVHPETQSTPLAPGHSLCRRAQTAEHRAWSEASGSGSGSLPPVVGSEPVTPGGSVPNGGNGRVTGTPMLSLSEQLDADNANASAASAQVMSRGFTWLPT